MVSRLALNAYCDICTAEPGVRRKYRGAWFCDDCLAFIRIRETWTEEDIRREDEAIVEYQREQREAVAW